MKTLKRNLKTTKDKYFSQSLALVFLTLLAILLTGCREGKAPSPTPDIYYPPTPASSPLTSTLLPSATPNTATTCTNYLSFLDDLTIPDGTKVTPGEVIVKRWQVANTGDCNWEEGYTIRLISGPDLGASPTQALYPARKGAWVPIEIIFTAPDPGNYTSMWQAHDPQGNPFGDSFYIEFMVEEE